MQISVIIYCKTINFYFLASIPPNGKLPAGFALYGIVKKKKPGTKIPGF
jgi:hypothetical protein